MGIKGFCFKWGGFSYDFDFYCGATTLEYNQPDLGASSNVVKLSESIPK